MNVIETQAKLNPTDRLIVEATAEGLPIVRDPYESLARDLGLTADEIMAAIEKAPAAAE